MRVVATAGHVDHGKSSLVLALTGTDPDRFPEEKARGLTIDLGFAFRTLPTGEVVGFVDVPGHVKFVKNMLAGVGAVEVALLVVAANEGWMPQTDEHVRILDLLGIHHGMIALTKAGLVDDDTLEIARLELDDRLAGTPFAEWPLVVVDSPSGRGIDDVARTLGEVLESAPAARDAGRPRLWVDRVFSARGAGTVVTGTLVGGALTVDDDVFVEPGHRRARVRAIESHHEHLTRVAPGSRVALNLAGIEYHDVHRGAAIVRPDQWAAARVVDVELRSLDGAAFPRRGELHAHVGSGEHRTRTRVLDAEGRYARLHFAEPLPLAPGDRLVLRSTGRRATVGGAEVLDVEPARRTADALARLRLPLPSRMLATRPWLVPDDLVPLAGLDRAAAKALADELVEGGLAARTAHWTVANSVLQTVRARVLELVAARHASAPVEAGLDLAALAASVELDPARMRAALDGIDELVVERDVVRHASHRSAATDDPTARALLDALDAAPFSPPAPSDVGAEPALVRALTREGLVIDLDGVLFSASAIESARRIVARAVIDRDTITIADIRDLLGSTRKYVLPIVNRMDAEGVTRRRGDDRIAGPRAQEVIAHAAGSTG